MRTFRAELARQHIAAQMLAIEEQGVAGIEVTVTLARDLNGHIQALVGHMQVTRIK